MHKGTITVRTAGKMEFIDITALVEEEIKRTGVRSGVCYLFNPHTTAGLTINEGADPAVQADIIAALREMVPQHFPYRHAEGNSPAHIMTTLTGSTLTVFFEAGKLELGTWQRIFFCEYDGPRRRKIDVRLLPTSPCG